MTKTLSHDTHFQRKIVFFNGMLPAVLLIVDSWRGKLGVNPLEFVTRTTGVLTLVFLVLTLLVTPMRRMFGWNWLLKQRRLIGLLAFFYGFVHLLAYIVGDRDWKWLTIPEDVSKRPFIAIGMASFFLMVPLAITSTNAMIKRMGGKRWALLHRLTYLVAIGGVVHYYMIVKSDIRYPALFGIVIAVLLGYRVWVALRKPNKPSSGPKES